MTLPTDPKTIWTPVQIIELLCTKMSPNDWRPVTACAVVLAESAGDPLAVGKLVYKPGSPAHLSLDLGIFQLNSYYQTVVNPYPTIEPIGWADCFNPVAAYEHVWKLITIERKGWNYDWSKWTTYITGAYDNYVSTAYKAMNEYRDTVLGIEPL
jgi:hypothetical protein